MSKCDAVKRCPTSLQLFFNPGRNLDGTSVDVIGIVFNARSGTVSRFNFRDTGYEMRDTLRSERPHSYCNTALQYREIFFCCEELNEPRITLINADFEESKWELFFIRENPRNPRLNFRLRLRWS